MPRYRDRTVPARVTSSGPLAQPILDVTFTDGYAPTTNDPDIISVHQGGTRTSALNEVGYFRGTWVTGHNSDAIFRAIATAGATGNAFELEDVTRTKRPFGVDPQTGHVKRYDLASASVLPLSPSAARPTDPATGSAFLRGGQFAGGPTPAIYGVHALTVDPHLCPTSNAGAPVAQELHGAKIHADYDMTLTTMSTRVRQATTGVAGYTGYAVYSDGTTMNLLGSTADDATLFQSTGQKPKALQTPVDLVGGNFYWFCVLANWSTTALWLTATASNGEPGVTNSWPAGNVTAKLAAQTSFPATITRASMSGNGVRYCIAGY